jgi:putative membrane protein
LVPPQQYTSVNNYSLAANGLVELHLLPVPVKTRSMKKIFFVLMAGATIVACKKDKLNDTDRDFATQAGYSNAAEISAGQLAASKGSSAMVRNYGALMATDHQPALNELVQIGTEEGLTVPTTPDPYHQALMSRLMSLSGYAFDTAYINSQIMDHQTAISLFQNEVDNGRRNRVQDYAADKLPHLHMHLTTADSIRTALH